ncbi:toll/interleukin-1 receptor domain-containing protein [Actinoplanes sp. DH11]|uniref:toll/interleukin-1 receptor domain-containing protein n=1 Tax=Actinoplanes sp. DH11 TaxID=2857011 RepID=UPI001E2B0321|nr:toll/interleukin-1 receptor domain-containing protein [Actinoplanes sp. DH11]
MSAKPIFISHANADKELVDAFVDYMLDIGANAAKEDVFYSSGHSGYGANSGTDLMAEIRGQIAETTLVIALVTPMYQARPVCIAELGAAWGRAGNNLFPVLLPGMSREELKGVLTPMTVRYMNDEDFLTELHSRACAAMGKKQDVASFTRAKSRWLEELKRISPTLRRPTVVTEAQLKDLQSKLEDAQNRLAEKSKEVAVLSHQIGLLKSATTEEDRKEALRPTEPIERFEALREEALEALRALNNRVVREVIRAKIGGFSAEYPNIFNDPSGADLVAEAIDAGHLKRDDEEPLELDESFPKVATALEAVEALQEFIADANDAFDEWFDEEFEGLPKKLSSKLVWDKMFPPSQF